MLYNLFQQLLAQLCVMTVHLLHISTSIIPTCKVFVVSPQSKNKHRLCVKRIKWLSWSGSVNSLAPGALRHAGLLTVQYTMYTILMCIYVDVDIKG